MSQQSSQKRNLPSEDAILFDCFGQYVFGELEIPGLSAQFDELHLPPTRRKTWVDWVITCGEDYQDAMKSNAELPKLTDRPEVQDPEVGAYWDELALDFSRDTWSALLEGTHSSQQSTRRSQLSQASKSRISLPAKPSDDQRQPKGRSSLPGPSHSSSRPKPKQKVPAPVSNDHDIDEIDEFFKRSRRKRSAPGHLSEYELSEDEDPFKVKAKANVKVKAKEKGKGKAGTIKSLPKKKLKGPSSLELKELRAAREGRAAESSLDDDSDVSEFKEFVGYDEDDDEEEVQEVQEVFSEDDIEAVLQSSVADSPRAHKSKKGKKGKKGKNGATKDVIEVINVDDIEDIIDDAAQPPRQAGLGSRGSKFVACFIPGATSKEPKVDKKTKAKYQADVQLFRCRCCEKDVRVIDEKPSSLALHFNPKSTSYCKYKFNPKDKAMQGFFDGDKDAPKQHPAGQSVVVTSVGGAASYTGSLVPTTNNVEHWLADGKRRTHKLLTAVVRRRSIAWIILESLPFTIFKSRSFTDMIEAIAPSALESFKSARQVKRDLQVVSMDLFDQAITELAKGTFSIQLDEWTTPGMQHAFQALVVTHIDKDWELHSHCIDFQVIRGRHSGSTFAGHVVSFLTDNGLAKHWNGILTTDSASSNARMSALLDTELQAQGVELKHPFHPKDNHIRCFAHHLNLVVQALYVALGVPGEESTKRNKIVEPVGGVVVEADLDEDRPPVPGVGEWSDREDGSADTDEEEEGNEEEEEDFDAMSDDEEEAAEALHDDMDVRLLPPRLSPIPEEDETDVAAPQVAPQAAFAGSLAVPVASPSTNTGAFESQSTAAGEAPGIVESQSTVGKEGVDTDQCPPPSGTPSFMSPLVKIATIVKIARSSPERRRKFLRKAREAYVGFPKKAAALRVPPAFNKTRWNSRFFQLHAALKFAKGLVYVVRSDENGDYDISLNLSLDEIKLLRKVTDVLAYFLTLTKSVEREAATAANILRYHGALAYALKVEIAEARGTGGTVGNFFAAALEVAADKLALYRERASACDPLLLASVLHPKYRLQTLSKDYPVSAVNRAKELLRKEVELANGANAAPMLATLLSPAGAAKPQWRRSPEPAGEADTDEISAYLVGGFPFRTGETILGWWRDNAKNLPVLAEVARRVLASAGSTAEVERVFSAAGRICTPRRRRIAPETIQQLVISQQLIKAGYDPMSGSPLPDDVPDTQDVSVAQ
ncbi:hypothetical protein CF319_g2029 [Tilletia indica]|nr:hypothetical protein CF319_g2029 [Tilletia indica]